MQTAKIPSINLGRVDLARQVLAASTVTSGECEE